MPVTRSSRPAVFRLLALAFAAVLALASCSNSSDEKEASPTTKPAGGGGDTGDSGGLLGEGPHGEFQEISDVPGVTDDEIKVALLSTGDANPIGYCLLKCQADGIEAYFEWRNSQGGIHGRKLVLDVIDDEFANNATRADEIIDGGEHFAVIGSPILADGFSNLTAEGIPVYASAVQSDIADGDESMFTPVGTVCITCPAPRTIWPVKEVGATKVGVLGFGIAQASKDCVAGTKAAFDEWGEPLGISAAYVNDDLPYGLPNGVAPEVSAMKRAGVDFITTCMDQNSVLTVEKELEKQGMGDVVVSLPNAYGDEEYLSNNAALLEGDIIGLMYRPLEANQEGTDFPALLEYMGKRNAAINDWAIISWINADMLFQGLLAAGPEFDQASVIEASNKITDMGSGGILAPVDWTKQHHAMTPEDMHTNAPERTCFAFVQVKGGKAELMGDKDKPQFCWNSADEEYKDPTPTSFAATGG